MFRPTSHHLKGIFSLSPPQCRREISLHRNKNTFKFYPEILYVVEIGIVEGVIQGNWEFVVKNSFSMKFVVDPVSKICWPIDSIVQHPFPIDAIVFKITLKVHAILIGQLPITILQIVPHHPLVFAVVFVILYHKDTPTHTTANFNLAIDLTLKPIIPSHFPFFANKLAIIVIKRLSFKLLFNRLFTQILQIAFVLLLSAFFLGLFVP